MTDILCGWPNREEAMISYLYDDLDVGARSAFDAHLTTCAPCRTELAQLRGVRRQLKQWEAPAVASLKSQVASPQSWWQEIPMWARAAAAILCIGAGAGLANVNVHYDQQGLTVRSGWLKSAVAPPAQAAPTPVSVAETSAPWRTDLDALERQLRTEFRSTDTMPRSMAVARSSEPSLSDAELLRRVRELVDESERRQQRELALRVGQVIRDVNAQRQSDLRKIDSNLGLIQNNTGAEVMKQRQLLNYLVRVSSQK